MEIIKLPVGIVWAETGDSVKPLDSKISDGWAVEAPARQHMNWWMNRADANMAYLLQHGIPEWDAVTEYILNKSYVQYNGNVYKALASSTNVIPGTDPVKWSPAMAAPTLAGEALKLVSAGADKLPYFTSTSAATVTALTPFARTILDDADAATVRATISAQEADATLTALAGTTSAVNKLPYFTGVDAADVTDLTAFARSLLATGTATTANAVLGAVQQTTADDVTVGRILKVGALGLGTSGIAITDANAIPVASAGTYALGTPFTNGPVGGGACNIIHVCHGAFAEQLAVSAGSLTPRMWLRNFFATWSTWVEVFHSGNSLPLGATLTTARTALTISNVDNTSDANKPVSGATSTALGLKADKASPTFTGVPAAPTAAVDTATVQVATTAFVTSQAASTVPLSGTVGDVGTSLRYARADHVHPAAGGTEPSITATTSADYYAGDKVFRNLGTGVRAAVLTGVSSAASTAVIATDTVLTAIGKLQGQLGNKLNDPGFAYVQSGTGVGQTSNAVKIGWSASSKVLLTVDGTDFGATWPMGVTGNSGTASALQTARNINGVPFNGTAAITIADDTKLPLTGGTMTGRAVFNNANTTMGAGDTATGPRVTATGTGDTNLAGMTFNNNNYAIHMGIRHDGVFGIGGWSRPAWSWYSDASGNMVAAGNVTAYSDPRLKENFKVVSKPFDILNKLDGGTFDWKAGYPHTIGKAGKRDYGVLADQVKEVMPEIITESIEIEGEKYLTVDYTKLIPVLIEAVKQLKAQVDELSKR